MYKYVHVRSRIIDLFISDQIILKLFSILYSLMCDYVCFSEVVFIYAVKRLLVNTPLTGGPG